MSEQAAVTVHELIASAGALLNLAREKTGGYTCNEPAYSVEIPKHAQAVTNCFRARDANTRNENKNTVIQ